MDFADVLASKQPTTGTVDIVLDPALSDAYHDARSALDEAKTASEVQPDDGTLRAAVLDAEDALVAAEEALRPAVVTFTLRALGKAEYEALKDDHAPTELQRKKARADNSGPLAFNPDTFPQALVAACSVDPVIAESDAEQMWKSPDWNAGELLELFWAAQGLQASRRVPDLGKGSGTTRS